MSMHPFSGETTPSLVNLDANFSELDARTAAQTAASGVTTFSGKVKVGGATASAEYPAGWSVVQLGSWGSLAESGYDAAINVVHGANSSGSTNDTTVWTYRYAGYASRYKTFNGAHYFYTAPIGTIGATITWALSAALDPVNGPVLQIPTALPSLTSYAPGALCFQLVSNTSLKILVRGSDGVTRSATLTLA